MTDISTRSIRVTTAVWARITDYQKRIRAKGVRMPTAAEVISAWAAFSEPDVIEEALFAICSPPSDEEIRATVSEKKAAKASGKRKH
jgi:hypothetical protein